MKLSIIIPVYNVERYIERCLESVVCQQDVDTSLYEVIVVNDGTPDKSMEIVEKYSNVYSNISIISQSNQGLSAARNNGMKVAKGEYIWFVDSDDWIESNCLSKILPYLVNNLDFLEIQYRNVYEDGRSVPGEKGCGVIDVRNGRDVTLLGGVHTAAQFCILRRKFLLDNKLEFVRGIYHEDVEFKIRALLLAERVTSTSDICYNYLQRSSGSITAHFKLKNAKDLIFVLGSHYNFVHRYDNNVKRAIYCKIAMWMNDIFLGMRELNREEYSAVVRMIENNRDLIKAMLQTRKFKYIVEGIILTLNVKMGLRLHERIRQ